MDPLFQIPEDIGALSADALQEFIDSAVATLNEIAADPQSFVTDDRDHVALRAEVAEAVEAVTAAREALAATEPEEPEDTPEPEANEEADPEAAAEEIAAMAAEAAGEPEPDPEPELAAEVEPEPEPVTASTTPAVRRRSAPARSAAHTPEPEQTLVPLLAAAGANDVPLGSAFETENDLARTMIHRRTQFGDNMPDGAENVGIAKMDWSSLYPSERRIGSNEELTAAAVKAVVDPKAIKDRFEQRRNKDGGSLVASGGLCAPVTPYYNLMMISVAERPVRAALPAFNADRGGIRAAAPAALSAITTGVGALTAGQDQAGATKTCQSVDCPPFTEYDVEIIYHCLRFGNLGARTFPERVAQWNNLVLAAHARLCEQILLSGIDAASTAVTANTLGLGASADLLSQVLVAAAAMRSRHRMDPDAVLRVLFPMWVLDLLTSDIYRSQFQRWDMGPDQFVALLRRGGVEPTFYIDSATGKTQVFGTQSAGALLNYPTTVTWYLFPEGSFLYLDGGILELGLVRDSVLNSTNDFEIFGESFENVAYIGVESLAITSTLCDSGTTSGTHVPTCPIVYSDTN